MPRGKKQKKDPFADLPSDFCDAVAGSDEAEIKSRLAKVTLDDEALRAAQKDDEDLQGLKATLKIAMEPYREAYKTTRLKIKYMRQVLGDKGKPNGDSSLQSRADRAVEEFTESVKEHLKPGESLAFVSPDGKSALISA